MAKHLDMQRAIHQYRLVTGKTDVEMRDVAEYAVKKLGMKLPQPVDPLTRLTKDFAKAAREETRYDDVTKLPYRANHAITIPGKDGTQTTLWGDIDRSKRSFIHKALQQRREQMVGDAWQLTLDADHWNSKNPKEEPIQIVMDFTQDVAERRAAGNDEEDDKAAE